MSDSSGVGRRRGRDAGGGATDSDDLVSPVLVANVSCWRSSRDWMMTTDFFDAAMGEVKFVCMVDGGTKEYSVDCDFCMRSIVVGSG